MLLNPCILTRTIPKHLSKNIKIFLSMLTVINGVKYCPHCGNQLTIGTAKFCHHCGKNLWNVESLNSPLYTNNEEDIVGVLSDKNNDSVLTGREFEDNPTYAKPAHSYGVK